MTDRSDERNSIRSFGGILLVGFMASGKSTVGRQVAERLGWRFVDVDEVVEEQAGSTIPEIFRNKGERHFRELEARLVEEFLLGREVVLAAGGGWPISEGRIESCPGAFLTVWLKVSPGTCLARARRGSVRPLLDVGDSEAQAEALLLRRVPYYRKARLHLETDDRLVHELVQAIVDNLTWAGGPLGSVTPSSSEGNGGDS